MAAIVLALALSGWMAWLFIDNQLVLQRERDRLRAEPRGFLGGLSHRINRALTVMGSGADEQGVAKLELSKRAREMTRKLQDAGLESAAEQGQYYLLRTISYVAGPALGSMAYLYMIPYYATLTFLFSTAIGIVIPMAWLHVKSSTRSEEIQRELPLLIDLTNLGTSAGWDVPAALERVVDKLANDFPRHPLIREFKKARWLAVSGYTWQEALARIGERLNNDSVRRCVLALAQAIKQGGDRTVQMEGIAEDAHRVYYGEVDRRLAGLPVKAVLLTMMLLVGYFMIIMAPAAVQLGNTGLGIK